MSSTRNLRKRKPQQIVLSETSDSSDDEIGGIKKMEGVEKEGIKRIEEKPEKMDLVPEKTKTLEEEDSGSSSDSSVENYLKPGHEIDLDSSFFTFEKIEGIDINKKEQTVSTLSESDENDETGENLEKNDGEVLKIEGKGFETLENYHRKLEEAKKAVETYKNRKIKEEKTDIKKLLSVGETQVEKMESSYMSASSDDEMDWEDLEKQNAVTQAVKEIPKEGVSITIETQTVVRKKKQDDYLMQVRRRLNRIRKENQVSMHKVHILCWIAHGNYVNSILNSENLLGRCLSLIPNENCYPPQRADLEYLEKITKWYSKNIKVVEKVTEKIPTISLERILQVQIAKKEASSKKNYVLIFICILRALGLQCRLILSLRTLPLRPPQSELCSLSTKNQESDAKGETSKNKKCVTSEDRKSGTSKGKKILEKIPKINTKENTKADTKKECSKQTNTNLVEKPEKIGSKLTENTKKIDSNIEENSEKIDVAKKVNSKKINIDSKEKVDTKTKNKPDKINANQKESPQKSDSNPKDTSEIAKSKSTSRSKISKDTLEELKPQKMARNRRSLKPVDYKELEIPEKKPKSSIGDLKDLDSKEINDILEKVDKNDLEPNIKSAPQNRRSLKLVKPETDYQKNIDNLKEVVIKVERIDDEQEKVGGTTKSVSTKVETEQNLIKSEEEPDGDPKKVDKTPKPGRSKSENRLQKETLEISSKIQNRNRRSIKTPENTEDPKKIDAKASKNSQRTSGRSKENSLKVEENPKPRSKSTSAISPEHPEDSKKIQLETSGISKRSSGRSKDTSLKKEDAKSRSKSTSAISQEKTEKAKKIDKNQTSGSSQKSSSRSKETSLKADDPKSRSKSTSAIIEKGKNSRNIRNSCNIRKSSLDLSNYSSEDEFKPDSRSLNSSRTSLSGFSPKNDVRNDIISILKGDMLKSKRVQRSKLVRKSNYSDSDDSDYMPEPEKKVRKSDSSDDFKQKKVKNSSGKIKQRVKPKSVLEKEEQDKLKSKNKKDSKNIDRRVLSSDEEDGNLKKEKEKIGNDVWCEVFLEAEEKWISVDVIKGQVHCVSELNSRASTPITYILAWNNNLSIKDVTSRYCPHMNTITRKLRIDPQWWNKTLKPYLGRKTARDKEEDEDLARQQLEQPLPKTIMEYKNHPLYALKRHLLKFEAIYPPDALTLGFVRNEPVYARECVHTLHSREIWIKHAKVVKRGEEPYKIVKARPKYDKLSGQMITDKPLEIFGPWQVEDYVPPNAENGVVPRNAFGNVELFKPCMLPGGTVYLQLPGLNKICRRLQIDCAPALVGFDYHSGGSHPLFDGFVVCEEFKDKLIKAWEEEQEEIERREQEKIEKRVYDNWKKLIKGLLIREKLKHKYGFETASGSGKSKKKPKGPRFVAKKRRVVSDSESSS